MPSSSGMDLRLAKLRAGGTLTTTSSRRASRLPSEFNKIGNTDVIARELMWSEVFALICEKTLDLMLHMWTKLCNKQVLLAFLLFGSNKIPCTWFADQVILAYTLFILALACMSLWCFGNFLRQIQNPMLALHGHIISY